MRKDMELRRGNPIQQIGIFPEFERLAESIFGHWPLTRSASGDIREEDNAYIVCADVPGIPKENIEVTVNGNVLTVHAEYKDEKGSEKDKNGYRREYRHFHQTFTLPTNVDADKVEAHCENGQLEVMIPKVEGDQQRRIEVKSRQRLGENNPSREAKEKH